MPEVAFHFNAPQALTYACRWVRKALRESMRVVVIADDATLRQFDQALWTFDAMSFVPHVRAVGAADVPARAAHTPVQLLGTLAGVEPNGAVVLNLGANVPQGVESFARVVEVVSQQEADRALARTRWQVYKGMGCALVRHEVPA